MKIRNRDGLSETKSLAIDMLRIALQAVLGGKTQHITRFDSFRLFKMEGAKTDSVRSKPVKICCQIHGFKTRRVVAWVYVGVGYIGSNRFYVPAIEGVCLKIVDDRPLEVRFDGPFALNFEALTEPNVCGVSEKARCLDYSV